MPTNKPAIIRKVIDITDCNDDELTTITILLIRDAACKAFRASELLNNLTKVFYIILNKLSGYQYEAIVRFAITDSQTSQAQQRLLQHLSKALAYGSFGYRIVL